MQAIDQNVDKNNGLEVLIALRARVCKAGMGDGIPSAANNHSIPVCDQSLKIRASAHLNAFSELWIDWAHSPKYDGDKLKRGEIRDMIAQCILSYMLSSDLAKPVLKTLKASSKHAYTALVDATQLIVEMLRPGSQIHKSDVARAAGMHKKAFYEERPLSRYLNHITEIISVIELESAMQGCELL